MIERGVEPVSLPELLARADIISMHSPATESANRLIREEHFRADEEDRDLYQHRPRPDHRRGGADQGARRGHDRRRRARRARAGAAGRQQPASQDGQRDPDRACRLGDGAVRPGAPPPGRPRIVAGAERQVADVLRQPVGAGGRAASSAGSRCRWSAARIPESPAGGADGYRQTVVHHRTGDWQSMAASWDPGDVVRYPDPSIKMLDPRFAPLRARQCGDRADRRPAAASTRGRCGSATAATSSGATSRTTGS